MKKGSGTRSGLLWEVERLLNECKELPQILLMENVPQVISKNNLPDFADWIAFLDSKGYTSKYQILNAKNYGVPQNRERCYMLSWLDKNKFYTFPEAITLDKRLKDMLEDNVDEKYYLSSQILNYFTKHSEDMKEKGNGFRFIPTDGNCVSRAITTRAGGRMDDNFIKVTQEPQVIIAGELTGDKWERTYKQNRRVMDADGISHTILTKGGGNQEPKVKVVLRNNQYEINDAPCAIDEQNKKVRTDGCVGTIVTDGSSPCHNNRVFDENYRVRKLTPKECWRLMGFDDDDFDKAEKINSNTQLYKQAGNSIVVDVLMAIFGQMVNQDE